MKTLFRLSLSFGLLLGIVALALAQSGDDPVFRAMQDELARSMTQLKMSDTQPPYFAGYRVSDIETATSEARYGALVSSSHSQNRYLYVEVRVGDSTLDNSGFVSDMDNIYNMREGVPDENDYRALRHKLWLVTDQAYKNALETLARKKAFLQTHPTRDSLADFSAAGHIEQMETPVQVGDFAQGKKLALMAAEALKACPALQDWKATCTGTATNSRYVNSDGARNLKASVSHVLEISATVQAADGQRLTGFMRYIVPEADALPGESQLAADVGKFASDLSAAASAPTLDEYTGPVLFEDYAAAQVISQLFVAQITPAREMLLAQDWMRRYLPEPGKLAGRINHKVMPEFVTVTDEPLTKAFQGQSLLGYQAVDDEGVASRNITLVKNGRLATLPSSRQPIKHVGGSNGHGLMLDNQQTVPAITNLMVMSAKPASREQLVQKLRSTCKETRNEYGLLVTMLEEPGISNDYAWTVKMDDQAAPLLTAPVLVYKVYAKDGKVEPVRGLVWDDVSIRSLRDMLALGKDSKAYGVSQPVFRNFAYYTSVVTPSLLFEEMELKSGAEHEPMPVSSNPIFAQ